MVTKKAATIVEPSFSKSQLVRSNRFNMESDLLNAVLQNNKLYTISEVEKKILDFKKGKVN